MKKVTVIIINYNSSVYTIACIKSIIELTSANLPYEIIVVDNNSQNADFENLRINIPDSDLVKLIQSKINLGFTGGNMLAYNYASAQYVFFLNNDCLLLNDNLGILYRFMEETPDAGLCTGQMYNSDKSFHHSFNYFPTLRLKLFGSSIMRVFSSCNYPSKKRKYMTPIIVPSITGAAMFVKSEVFSKIGGLDPNYFLYCEEEDLCYRIKANSYNVYLVPDAKFIHHMGKSTNRNNDNAKEYYISLLYFMRKYYTYIEYTLLKFIYFYKNLKKFYRGVEYIKLAFFILQGAPLKYSLRFKQKTV